MFGVEKIKLTKIILNDFQWGEWIWWIQWYSLMIIKIINRSIMRVNNFNNFNICNDSIMTLVIWMAILRGGEVIIHHNLMHLYTLRFGIWLMLYNPKRVHQWSYCRVIGDRVLVNIIFLFEGYTREIGRTDTSAGSSEHSKDGGKGDRK